MGNERSEKAGKEAWSWALEHSAEPASSSGSARLAALPGLPDGITAML